MAELLARVKISTKIVAVLVLLGLVTVGVAISAFVALSTSDKAYSKLVNVSAPATVQMLRVNRLAQEMMYAGYRVMAYPGGSAEGKAAAKAENEAYTRAMERSAKAQGIDPSFSEIPAVRQKIDDLHAGLGEAIRLGSRNENEAARQILARLDETAIKVTRVINDANDKRIADS